MKITDKGTTLSVFGNPITLKAYKLAGSRCDTLVADGKPIEFRQNGEKIIFAETVIKRKLEVGLK